MKLHDHFAGLLQGTVNINADRLEQLERHVAALSNTLQDDEEFAPNFQRFIPQGSWAHRTIIKPMRGTEFDADILVEMKYRRDWLRDPQLYIYSLHEALRRSGHYRARIELKTRCVRVDYAGDCHVDLVPSVREGMYSYFDNHYIVNRKDNKLEHVNPEGFAKWLRGRDRTANGHLRTSLRLLKYLRNRHGTFDVPSVILTNLVGGRVTPWLTMVTNPYPDLPSAFTYLTRATDRWLQARPTLPRFEDPSCAGVEFGHRLNDESYRTFRKQFHGYSEIIQAASHARNHSESVELWRQVFGEAFTPNRSG